MAAPIKTLLIRSARHAPAIMSPCPRTAAPSSIPTPPTMKLFVPITTITTTTTTHASRRAASTSRRSSLCPTTTTTTTTIAATTRFFGSTALVRAASATRAASPSPASPARPASSPPTASASSPPTASASKALDWDLFFRLRLKRRRIQMAFSVVSGLAGAAAGGALFFSGVADPLFSMVPLEPIFVLALSTICAGGLGWLAGPSVGGQLFYLFYRRDKALMVQMESQFLARVKKYRSDPANSSAVNRLPDFYGEKISSVSDYRRWLKDQKNFTRKKNADFV